MPNDRLSYAREQLDRLFGVPVPAPKRVTPFGQTDCFGRLVQFKQFAVAVQEAYAGQLFASGSLRYPGAHVTPLHETEKLYQQVVGSVALPTKDIDEINRWIRIGVKKILPSKLLHRRFLGYANTGKEIYSETQILDDIQAKVWIRLLADGTLTTKAAYNQGRAAATDYLREDAKFPLVEPTPVDPEEKDSEMNSAGVIAAYDLKFADISQPVQYEENVFTVISEMEDRQRNESLCRLKAERPEDYTFLTEYARSLRRGAKKSLRDRNRALSIKRWMQRNKSGQNPATFARNR